MLWDAQRLWVYAPKTAHHEGKEDRCIPLFPELAELLQDSFDLAEPGEEFVLPDALRKHTNAGVQLNRMIRRAGLQPVAEDLRESPSHAQHRTVPRLLP